MFDTPRVCVRPPSWIGKSDTTLWDLLEWVQTAEELELDGVFVGDRLLAQAASDGQPVYGASMLDPIVVLSTIAAQTRRIHIGPLIMVVPFRHPVQLAKSLASLDVASGGRLILGAGLGWAPAEFEALGIPMAERAPRFEQSLDIMRQLWRGEAVQTDPSSIWPLNGVEISPVPPRGSIPVWIASFSPDHPLSWPDGFPPVTLKQLSRVGRLADGWVPLVYSAAHKSRISPQDLATGWDEVLASAQAAGRTRADLDFVYSDWCYVLESPDDVDRCRAALANFFDGTWEEALRTYTIGTHAEVVAALNEQASLIDHVDAYVLTPLSNEREQLVRLGAVAQDLKAQ